jgi:predicted restriction endonuclease
MHILFHRKAMRITGIQITKIGATRKMVRVIYSRCSICGKGTMKIRNIK